MGGSGKFMGSALGLLGLVAFVISGKYDVERFSERY